MENKQEEPKQTDEKENPLTYWGGLEKTAFKKYPRSMSEKDSELRNIFLEGLEFGIKYQQEQDKKMYSEQDRFRALAGLKPKQENCCTPIGQIKRYKDCIGCDKKPKQQTLEELSLQKYPFSNSERNAFITGYNQSKEEEQNMYSEEDIINALHSVELKDNKDYSKIYNGMKEWFEQFLKK
jgi:hypothetical protein